MTAPNQLTTILYSALAEPVGLFITSTDLPRLRASLHNAKRATNDPALDVLTIRTSPKDPTGELWIVRTDVGDDPRSAD